MNVLEPRPPVTAIEPPETLTDAAVGHWMRLAPMLTECGILKASDFDTLALYCEGYAQFIADRQEGKFSASLVGQLRQLLGELGMTPSARTRIVADKEPEHGQEKGRFFSA